jgi:Flp pilus assembly pilin Flp
MRNLMLKLWNDDRGALVATEWVFVSTILVVGIVAGLKSVQQTVNAELADMADAIGALSQAYSYGGVSGCAASSNGSLFADRIHDVSVQTNAANFNGQSDGGCPE